MSDTEDNAESGICSAFEPQAWRKTLCRNCFHNLSEHDENVSATVPEQDKTKAEDAPKQDDKKGKITIPPKTEPSVKKPTPVDKVEGHVNQEKNKTKVPSLDLKAEKKEATTDTSQKNVPSSSTSKQSPESSLKLKIGEKDRLKKVGVNDTKAKVGKLKSSFASKFDKSTESETSVTKDKDLDKQKTNDTKSNQSLIESNISKEKGFNSIDKPKTPSDKSKEIVSKEPDKSIINVTSAPPSSKTSPLTKSQVDDAKTSISDKNKYSHSKNETEDSKRSASSKFGTKLPASGGSRVQQLASSKFGTKTDALDVRKGQKNTSDKIEGRSETQSPCDVSVKGSEGEHSKAVPSTPSSSSASKSKTSPSFVKSLTSPSTEDSKEKVSSVSSKQDASGKSVSLSSLGNKKETATSTAPSTLKETPTSPQPPASTVSKQASEKKDTGRSPDTGLKRPSLDIKGKTSDLCVSTGKSTLSSPLGNKKDSLPLVTPTAKKDTPTSPQPPHTTLLKESGLKKDTDKLKDSDKKQPSLDKTKSQESSILSKKESFSKDRKVDLTLGSKDTSSKDDTKKASPTTPAGVTTPTVEVTHEKNTELMSQLKSMEEKCKRLEEEKSSVSAKHLAKMEGLEKQVQELKSQLSSKESLCAKLESDNKDILKKIERQKSQVNSTQAHEIETAELKSRLEQSEHELEIHREENERLREEMSGMREEMDEMYDSFRDNEIEEIREIQRELEQTAKNCRVLQFKLRKSDRKNEQLAKDKSHFEDKLRTLQSQFNDDDAKEHIKALEEELKAAKEVTVRLQDDIDILEDKKVKAEDENSQLTELLEKADKKQFRLEMEIDKLHDKILDMKEEMQGQAADLSEERKKVFAFQL